ncbi:hypothetical protein M406DRAFT_355143 [Cryphonectria parasitica EP155]|uniref:Cyanovirin-N domain-containing protein n=1 Tax=Cryphonectria parasitica (strain ATCC 38755 / EP155) TaxID=660469 RepID=A0A9P4Y940_CRYP1|nr:uncharacterized protein M406DRAFT_355143 [Cryphonectria parasitica EP155]KAF3769063.1 hypothetical protein M406DRAFT_355143 [Cryphonectria parasitica EP155]
MKKAFSILASVVSLAAATPRPAVHDYVIRQPRAAASTDCIPENFTVSNFFAAGSNSTSLDEAYFSYLDPHTGLTTTCELNSTSVDLSAEGSAYANYACDDSLLKFQWGYDEDAGGFLLGVAETICNGTYSTSDSWIPDLICQNCTSGLGVECKLPGNDSYTADFSGIPQPVPA